MKTVLVTNLEPIVGHKNTFEVALKFMHGDADKYETGYAYIDDQRELATVLEKLDTMEDSRDYDMDYINELTGKWYNDCTCDGMYYARFQGYDIYYYDGRGTKHNVKYKIADMPDEWSPDYIYEKMREWEIDNGEGFVDYFDTQLNGNNFMYWCRAKNYITREQLVAFQKEYTRTNGLVSANDYLSGYEEPYAVRPQREDFNDDQNYEQEYAGMKILAEFMSESDIYIKRFIKFLYED